MKKALSIILLSVLLLSVLAFPISAETTASQATYTATYKSDKTVTVDGVMNDAEGYGSTPVTYFDQTFGSTTDTSFTKRGEVYVSYDQDNMYVFLKFYSGVYTYVDSGNTQTFIKANFGTAGTEEIGFWGTSGTRTCNENTNNTIKTWSVSDTKSYNSVSKNSSGLYNIEIRLPIPAASKAELLSSGLKVRLAVCQGLGDATTYWGASLGSTAKVSAEKDARDAVNNGDEILLPVIPVADGEVRYVGAQSRVNPDNAEKRDVRFVAVIADYAQYEALGYDMTYNGASATVNCYTVYESLLADGETVYAENYGGQYFFAYTLKGLEKGNEYTFEVTPFTKTADADKVPSDVTATVTVSVAVDGEVTITRS